MAELHQPVMALEVVERLLARPDGVILDGTTGTGGHAEAILRRLAPTGRLVCLDQDSDALHVAEARLGGQGERVRFYRGTFSELDPVLRAEGIEAFDGILLDLGLNSWSLAQPGKGLSYLVDGPLLMLLDPDLQLSARELLARAGADELEWIFREFGGVHRPHLLVRRLLQVRANRPIRTTFDLVRALSAPGGGSPGEAEFSRIFQALRVAVCREMERLEQFLDSAAAWVKPGGRLLILTYAGHEVQRLRAWARGAVREEGLFTMDPARALQPGREEVLQNRRARSAKLFCFARGGA